MTRTGACASCGPIPTSRSTRGSNAIIDMKTPGVEARPFPSSEPDYLDFNEVFFTDAGSAEPAR